MIMHIIVSMRLEEQELGAVLACFPKKYNPAAWPPGLIPSQPSPHGLDSAKAIYGVGGMGGPAKGCVDLGGRGYCRGCGGPVSATDVFSTLSRGQMLHVA